MLSPHSHDPNDKTASRNMMLALILCALLIVGWQFFVEIPKRERLATWHKGQEKIRMAKEAEAVQQREEYARQKEALASGGQGFEALPTIIPRVKINTPTLHGSISLQGPRFDDLTLANYNETLDENSPEVVLLSSSSLEGAKPYFSQVGWLSDDKSVRVPGDRAIWQTNHDQLAPDAPVTMSWDNGEGITFYINVSVDEDYMFHLEQTVNNRSGKPVKLRPYTLINRGYEAPEMDMLILHNGPIGVLDGVLEEIAYDEIEEENVKLVHKKGWLGITDKYWLTAFIPDEGSEFSANMTYYKKGEEGRYQIDTMGDALEIPNGAAAKHSQRFFAGAKELSVLDAYAEGQHGGAPIALFDRAVDFGYLYFITKPIFLTLGFFYKIVGNFGIAIILLTFLIKVCLFPIAAKGYRSMKEMKRLGPDMTRIKNQYKDEPMKAQQEIIALYKKEKVNPASGCLPMFIQLPVFFALYKVLFVTIEMRHAPFMGPWQDLSAMDPTNLFTAFGLIPWDPPSFLTLGILPIIMAASMWYQMRLQPAPPDPMQAKIMKLMPLFLLIIVKGMPAGLVLYWCVSNMLSIVQQQLLTGGGTKKA